MEQIGLHKLLELQTISEQSHTGIVPWWWWVFLEQFSPHRMEQLGLQGLREQRMVSGTSPTETVPLWQ